MALADYYLCDVCGGKAFYDANVEYGLSHVAAVCSTCATAGRRVGVIDGLQQETTLLRRERALLIDLEKVRAAIIGCLLEGAVPSSLIDDVFRLNAAVQALHLEASGGIERPPGSPCRCVLCAPREEG